MFIYCCPTEKTNGYAPDEANLALGNSQGLAISALGEIYFSDSGHNQVLKVDPTTITIEQGFTRDVRQIGHWGTGDLELSIRNKDDLRKAYGRQPSRDADN